jgi:hypothetical protein
LISFGFLRLFSREGVRARAHLRRRLLPS